MARYWGQQKEESLTTVGGGSENLQGVSASDRKRWDGKQDQLTYDNKPMRGSVNVLNSDAIARAFEEFKDAISTAYKQYLSTQVTSYAEMVVAVTNAKNDVDNAYVAIEKYETNMRVLYEDTLSKLTDAQNIFAGATTLLNKTNTESSALSAKIKQLESAHSSVISDLNALRNALANVEKDTDRANIRIEELISKANDVDTQVTDLVKVVEDALAEIETEKEDTLTKIRAVRDSIPDDYEKVCEDVKEVRQELIDARRRGTWITSETVSGEMVHATDCAPITPLGLKLFGKGKQRQYEGNQLFDSSFRRPYDGTISGYGCTIEESNGVFLITANREDMFVNDVVNKGQSYYDNSHGPLMVIPDEATEISVKFSNTELNQHFITYYDENKISLGTTNDSSSEFTRTIKTGTKYVSLRFGKNNAVVGTTYKTTVMVNFGEPMDYEPFVGNEPSPSMKYPQKPEFLGESGSIGGKVCAGNIIPPTTNESTTSNGVTFDVLEDGIVHAHGTSTGNAEFKYIGGWMAKTGVTIPKGFVFPKTINGVTINMYGYNDTGLYEHISSTDNSGYSDVSVLLNMGAGYTVNTLVRPYACKEEILTDYAEPQPFTFQTPNGLRGIPLGQTIPDTIKNSPIHMSGVYWDGEQYQIADTENENGKDVQRIGEYIITKNEYWQAENDSFGGQLPKAFVDCCLFTHGVRGVQFEYSGSVGWFHWNKDYNEWSTLEEWKENIIGKTIYYILAEPIITDTTEEEKAQLDALVMNYPNTTIVNDAGAYMVLTYGKDAEAYINENYTSKTAHEALVQRVQILEEEIIKL